jgi:TolB protein
MRKVQWMTALAGWLLTTAAQADLTINITRGVTDPVPVAVVPFAQTPQSMAALDVAGLVERDLQSSGRFRALARNAMPARPTQASQVDAAAWRALRNDYVIVGRQTQRDANEVRLEFELLNALTGQVLLQEYVSVTPANLRHGAHRVADRIFQKITGTRGAFATRIAYISVEGQPPSQRYQLMVADADGETTRVAMQSSQPIMSPAWSPDGQWLAYVSFENRASAVYVQRLSTGERRQVSARAGINGAPAWSPDGSKLALTLSGGGGNLDIYVIDLATQESSRITDDPAIDTEPVWAADGQTLYFTSDRGGAPQSYRAPARVGARAQRVTFGGAYAARPRISPDGRTLAVVMQQGGSFRIGIADPATGQVSPLTRGPLDESPSFAPNGATLIYAGRVDGRGVLATVSVDGQVSQQLKSEQGEVREPVWGPFIE